MLVGRGRYELRDIFKISRFVGPRQTHRGGQCRWLRLQHHCLRADKMSLASRPRHHAQHCGFRDVLSIIFRYTPSCLVDDVPPRHLPRVRPRSPTRSPAVDPGSTPPPRRLQSTASPSAECQHRLSHAQPERLGLSHTRRNAH